MLNPRSIVLIVLAIVFAGGTAMMARSWIQSEKSQAGPAEAQILGLQILVAKQNLPTGLIIKEEHLRWQAWPKDTLADSYIKRGKATPASFEGAVVRKGIVAGQPVTNSLIVKPGQRGFLAAVITPGMRAVSVPISAVSGISGFVFPGDRIDLVMTHEIMRGDRSVRASETVLTNVRVLAIDQTTNDQNASAQIGKTATLELTPKQVEQIAIVQRMVKHNAATLSLSLRSLPDTEAMPNSADSGEAAPSRGKTYTLVGEVSRLLSSGNAGSGDMQEVRVARGTNVSTVKFRK